MRRPAALALLLALVGGIAVAVALGTRSSGTHSRRAASTRSAAAPRRRTATTAPKIVRGPHDAPVPILMYHVLGVPRASAPYPELFVKPDDLSAQLRWLARHGYHAVTLGQVFRYWRTGLALPKKPIVVSFDDGY